MKSFGNKELLSVIVDQKGTTGKICNAVPINVENNCTFIVDSSKLECPEDIRSDDCGVWRNNGVRVSIVSWNNDEAKVISRRYTKDKKERHEYSIIRTYFVHKSHSDFRKMITKITGIRFLLVFILIFP